MDAANSQHGCFSLQPLTQSEEQEAALPELLWAPPLVSRFSKWVAWVTQASSYSLGHFWTWAVRVPYFLIIIISHFAPRRVAAYLRHLESANQNHNMKAFRRFLSIADFDNKISVVTGTLLSALCFATTSFAIESGAEFDLFLCVILPLTAMFSIATVTTGAASRSRLKSYEGLSFRGMRRHLSGPLVKTARSAAAPTGFCNLALILYLTTLGYIFGFKFDILPAGWRFTQLLVVTPCLAVYLGLDLPQLPKPEDYDEDENLFASIFPGVDSTGVVVTITGDILPRSHSYLGHGEGLHENMPVYSGAYPPSGYHAAAVMNTSDSSYPNSMQAMTTRLFPCPPTDHTADSAAHPLVPDESV